MLMLRVQTKAQKVVEFCCEFELLEKVKTTQIKSPVRDLGVAVLLYSSFRIKDVFLWACMLVVSRGLYLMCHASDSLLFQRPCFLWLSELASEGGVTQQLFFARLHLVPGVSPRSFNIFPYNWLWFLFLFYFYYFEPRVLHMLSMHFTTKLTSLPLVCGLSY